MNKYFSNEDIYYITDDISQLPFYITIAGVTYPDPSYHINRKNSRVFCIEYILEGSGTIEVDGKQYTVEKGDVYMLHQNTNHLYYSSNTTPWKKIWFNASGPLVQAVVNSYGLEGVNIIKDSDSLSFFERIVSLCKDVLPKSVINEKSALIFHELIAYLSNFTETNVSEYSDEVIKMKEYIDNHLTENVSSETLAGLIFKSKSQATRIFKSEMGTTPYDYLLERRFSQAKSLLRSTNLLIKEISYRCGFTDEHYFSDIFRRKCGTTPREYRNK